MKVRVRQFIDFAYGDKRRDKAKVKELISDIGAPYDPTTDRYKQFREALTAFEDGKISATNFSDLPNNVSANKQAGYKVLCKNYVELKEDNALVWQGRSPVEVNIAGLRISTAWYLRTEVSNQNRIVFLHFGKEQLPRKKERGLLAILCMAKPDAAGVGILNIQPGTLITATRLDEIEAAYLEERAHKFMHIVENLEGGS